MSHFIVQRHVRFHCTEACHISLCKGISGLIVQRRCVYKHIIYLCVYIHIINLCVYIRIIDLVQRHIKFQQGHSLECLQCHNTSLSNAICCHNTSLLLLQYVSFSCTMGLEFIHLNISNAICCHNTSLLLPQYVSFTATIRLFFMYNEP